MLAIVVSTEITRHFFGISFFTAQLKRRKVDLRDGFESEVLDSIKIRQILDRGTHIAAETIGLDMPISEIREKLSASSTGELFVVQPDGQLYGTISLQDCGATLFDNDCDTGMQAADIARRHPPILNEGDNLGTALLVMHESSEDHIAVLSDPHSKVFTGCVHHRDVMTAYNRELLKVRHEEHNQ